MNFKIMNYWSGIESQRRAQVLKQLMDFPVLLRDGSVVSSLSLSQALGKLPIVTIDYVFIDPDPDIRDHAEKWLKKNKTDIITPKGGEEL